MATGLRGGVVYDRMVGGWCRQCRVAWSLDHCGKNKFNATAIIVRRSRQSGVWGRSFSLHALVILPPLTGHPREALVRKER